MGYRQELSFGLDIGERSLKALQFLQKRKETRLVGFSELALPTGLIENGEILNTEALAIQIRKVIQLAKLNAAHVVIALPEKKTFLKLLSITAPDPQALLLSVETEFAKHLPYELNQVWWDFTVIQKKEGAMVVLAGAAPRSIVASYTNLLRQAGLTPVIFDLEPLAIARSLLEDSNVKQCALLADIGATKSTLVVATSAAVILTADARASGEALTSELSDNLKITVEIAEEMKRKYGLAYEQATPKSYAAIIDSYSKRLVSRIRDLIDYTSSHETLCPDVSQVLLSGGGALLTGLPDYMTKMLKLPVRLGDPWVNTRDTIGLKVDPQKSLTLTTVAGLALTALKHDHSNSSS